ncbi:MAG: site-specific DNA-methyltransferase [Oscillospiraceae bacterium]|nr:site-specific DNA-methyltransferase [Oscillospiraceae bacterium]
MYDHTTHKIINGDSRNMDDIADGSVDLIITSPPYWQLKDYGTPNQIGFDDDYETYINHLNLVWSECFRVLSDGCRLCINIGDQFARSVYYGRYKVIPIHSEIIRFCETLGLDFMGKIIWQKNTTMNTTGGGAVMGSFPYPRNGIVKLDYEYILIFKKQGKSKKPTIVQKEKSKMTTEEWNTYFSGHWNFAGAKQDKHLAMFPDELPRRLIKMFSFVGETVLDPFAGSGTTAKVARELNRNSINYEINSNFISIINSKVGNSTEHSTVSSITQKTKTNVNYKSKFCDLPYQYSDVHKLDKKIDVKMLTYGSKISKDSTDRRETLYKVKKILSPEILELDNGTLIRLIGIKTDDVKAEKAIEYLFNKVNGKKVFIKSDDIQYNDNTVAAYMYLENKTFVNAHLLKSALVHVDNTIAFKLNNKFNAIRYS